MFACVSICFSYNVVVTNADGTSGYCGSCLIVACLYAPRSKAVLEPVRNHPSHTWQKQRGEGCTGTRRLIVGSHLRPAPRSWQEVRPCPRQTKDWNEMKGDDPKVID